MPRDDESDIRSRDSFEIFFFFFLIFFFNFYISEAYLTMTQSQIGERILCYANQGNWGGYACLENQ